MIEVLSIVNFDNQDRVDYLEKSFGSFYKFNKVGRHVVVDSSTTMGKQKEIYDKLGVEYYHKPTSYSQRFKFGVSLLKNDYFIFLPDDYEWIFEFPIEDAISESRKYNVAELKLVMPPMQWFSVENPTVESWHDSKLTLKEVLVPTAKGNFIKRVFWNLHTRLTRNERLVKKGELCLSTRHFRRSFQQQFSLGCHILQTKFSQKLTRSMPGNLYSPGEVEKNVYKQLMIERYLTGYYKMKTPAFHFIDLKVEGIEKKHVATTNLIKQNQKFISR